MLEYLDTTERIITSTIDRHWHSQAIRNLWSDYNLSSKNLRTVLSHFESMARYHKDHEWPINPLQFISKLDSSDLASHQGGIDDDFINRFITAIKDPGNMVRISLLNNFNITGRGMAKLLEWTTKLTSIEICGLESEAEQSFYRILPCLTSIQSVKVETYSAMSIILDLRASPVRNLTVNRVIKTCGSSVSDDINVSLMHLESLALARCSMINSLPFLGHSLPKLRSMSLLQLYTTTDDTMIQLLMSSAKNIEEIVLEGSDITDISFCTFKDAPNLTQLALHKCLYITLEGFRGLSGRGLKVLDLTRNAHIKHTDGVKLVNSAAFLETVVVLFD